MDLIQYNIPIFKDDKEASKWLKKNIRYETFRVLKSYKDVVGEKRGDCHSQAILIKYILQRLKMKPRRLFFIEYNSSDNKGGMTHTLVYYNKNGKIYWLENAWGGSMNTIHGPFKNITELKEYINSIHNRMSSSKKYNKLKFAHVKNVTVGMKLGEYVSSCLE
ncbi:MAG: hypothetical protein PHF63_00040 [Herbinix sp.]|nr:hypothetical protein [Herbinix sp.]